MTARSATLTTLRDMNARSVLDALVLERRLSRAEVARRLGMSKPTAAHAVDVLLSAGLVREAARPDGELHYGAVFFEPVLDIGHVLGLDVGGSYVRGALADLAGSIVARYDHPRLGDDPEDLLSAVAAVRSHLLADTAVGGEAIVGTVAAVAGVVDPAARGLKVSNAPHLENYPLVDELREILPGALDVDNDVNLAALGELEHGAGRDIADFAFLSVGSGVGAGLVLDGRLRRGHNGAAGEIDYPGHRPFAEGSPAADSFEQLVIHRLAGPDGAEPGPPPSAKSVFARAQAGDRLAGELAIEEARRIARSIATITLVVDVPLIVLGGGIGLGCEVLLDYIRGRLTELVPYPPRVTISELGDAATLTGAVTVAARAAWPRIITARLTTADGAASADI